MNRRWAKRLCLFIAAVFISAQAGCGLNRSYDKIAIANSAEIAESIRSGMMRRAFSMKVTFRARTLRRDQVKSITDELIREAFYESDDPCGGDYLRFQYGGYEVRHTAEKEFFRYKYTARIRPVYFTTKEQEEAVSESVEKAVASFGLDENASDYEKARCVRDFVVDLVRYDTVHKHQAGSGHIQSTAYGALIYHTAMCQGYSVLTYRLLKELGLDTRIITGMAEADGKAEYHAWNLVSVDGKFYNMDVTLDDVKGTEDYFLKSDKTFAADHKRDKEYLQDEFYEEYPMAAEDYSGVT